MCRLIPSSPGFLLEQSESCKSALLFDMNLADSILGPMMYKRPANSDLVVTTISYGRLIGFILLVAIGAVRIVSTVKAQDVPPHIERPSDAADIFTIWPGDGVPPGAEDWTWHEQTMQMPWIETPSRMARNVVIPTLTMFKPPADSANGTALIVAPGGAFHFLAMDHEGYDVARWLTQRGVTVFVLKYRVQRTPQNDAEVPAFLDRLWDKLPEVDQTDIEPPMGYPPAEEARLWGEEDGRRAIRYVREHAVELSIDPNRIGIMGFSAGGGIAVNAALEHDSLSRPDFVGGIYPGHRTGPPVPENAPPLFIAIADNDNAVAPMSSSRLYEAWHKAGASAELHIFSEGGHGFGMRDQGTPSDAWTDLFDRWMVAQGFLAPPAR